MNNIGEKYERNDFFKIKPARIARLLLDTYLGANILILTSLRSELLHERNLDSYKPRGSSTLPLWVYTVAINLSTSRSVSPILQLVWYLRTLSSFSQCFLCLF